MFSVNCNRFGPYSEGKIDQIKKMSKLRNTCGFVISSSDDRWNVKNEMNVIHRLKI